MPRRAPLRLAILFASFAVAVALASWGLRGGADADLPVGGDGRAVAGAPAIDAPAVDGPVADGLLPPAERVAFWEARIANGGGYLDRIHLADAYLDRARASGDIADLRRADAALAAAAETAPNLDIVRVREALVAFALHEFDAALATANVLLDADPANLTALSVAGDSLLELGDTAAAAVHYERLAELAPSAPSWSRLGRLAFLRGDLDEATRLVEQATLAADEAGFPDEIAFYHFQLGDLYRMSGRLADAEAAYLAALDALPEFVPATSGLAHVREAQGRRDEAIALLESALDRLPQPELVAALGDLYALAGDVERAEERYALVGAVADLYASEGVYDRSLALFAADHGRHPDEAVQRATAELEIRGDVYTHDALAWALYAAGRLDEAASEALAALGAGTADPRIAYHAGMIAAAQGRTDEARALLEIAVAGAAALPPLQVPRAEEALATLGGGEVAP